DDSVLFGRNRVAASADVLNVSSVGEDQTSPGSSEPSLGISSATDSAYATGPAVAYSSLPAGLPGLARAIRSWRRRPYEAQSAEWAVERFANAIGYRLVELAGAGRHHEAASTLRSLGDSVGFGERS